MKIRLQKYMADQGIASRRKSEEFIAAGMVKVNGKVVTEMGVKIDPEVDQVEVDGQKLEEHNEQLVYIKLNKPKGYECSTTGPDSVLNLIDVPERIFYVGRLDKDSEGLLLFTNDGQLTYKLTHPKFKKSKLYEVTVDKPISDDTLNRMARGVKLLNKKTAVAEIDRISNRKFLIKITEGMNRQIRRMCRTVEYRVHKLKRLAVGEIELGNLELGDWAYLDEQEMDYIKTVLNS